MAEELSNGTHGRWLRSILDGAYKTAHVCCHNNQGIIECIAYTASQHQTGNRRFNYIRDDFRLE